MNNNSDINIGSIEEDIEILDSIVKVNKDFLYDIENQTISQKEIKALEHLLKDYTRQKQINEQYQKINEELREKIKALEENRMFKNNKVLVSRYFKLKDNSIPKQKIKDKIEEYYKKWKKIKEMLIG